MYILHINCNYLGNALHSVMMRNLVSLGYDNLVYTPTYDSRDRYVEPDKNVVVSECFKKWDRIVFDYKQKKISNDLQRKVDISGFDCIHAHTLFTDGNCARKISKKYNVPYVVSIRNTDVNTFFAKMIHLRTRGIKIMMDAKAIFFLSEAYRKKVFEKYVPLKYREELYAKTRIVPNGINNFWLENPPSINQNFNSSCEIKLIYAGRIDKNKNIPTTQKAVRILREKGYNVSLTVVGRSENESEYEKIKCDSSTVCIPAVPKEKLIDMYRASHIFVMPSFTETFGLSYVEAMSQGLPVIYSKDQGFDGQFPEGEVGYHVDPYSAESVANGILKVIEKYDLLHSSVSKKASKFNWSEIVKEYARIYDDITI